MRNDGNRKKYYRELTALMIGDVWGSGVHPVVLEHERVKGSVYEETTKEEYNSVQTWIKKRIKAPR